MVDKKIRILKLRTEFTFDSAHRLVGYNGNCENVHGHQWRVTLEIKGSSEDLDNVGILWDFKKRKEIKELFDHKTILKDCKENKNLINSFHEIRITSTRLMNVNPTAENLCMCILDILEKQNNKLKYKVRVYENPNSYCEVKSDG